MTTTTRPAPLAPPRVIEPAAAVLRRSATTAGRATLALVALYVVAVCTRVGQWVDTRAMAHAFDLSPTLTRVSQAALAHYHEGTYAVLAVVVLGVGWWRRGTLRAVVAAAVLVGSVLGTEALKHHLPRPALTWLAGPIDTAATLSANSFPSGHTAGIAGVVAAITVLTPARHRRVVVVVGAAAMALVGLALVVAQWHRPSDVLGSALTATVLGALGCAAVDPAVHAAARRRVARLRG